MLTATVAMGLVFGLGTGVGAATVSLSAVKTATATVAGCKTTTGTVTLSAVAPSGGVTVALSSTNSAATVPASVFVTAGTKSKSFTVKAVPVSSATTGAITATYGGVTKSTPLTVRTIGVAGLVLKPTSVAGGETAWGRARLECVAAPGTVSVQVVSADNGVAAPTVSTVRIPAGIKDGYFMIEAAPTSVGASASFSATTPGGPIRRSTLTVTAPSSDGTGGYANPVSDVKFDHFNAYEVSGLDVSVRNPGYAYMLDDGPGTTAFWAVRLADGAMQRLELSGFVGTDTEDLAVAPCSTGGASCLYIGDIGDNTKRRASIRVLRMPEPDLSSGGPTSLSSTSITLKYPNGARNAETLLVDDAGKPYIVIKEPGTDNNGAARLYGATSFVSTTLTDYGAVPVPLPAQRWTGSANIVTGGDYKDGRVILRTYDHAIEYRGTAGADLNTFASWSRVQVPVPRDPKGEAISYLPSCGYITASEMVSDIFAVDCQ